MASAENIPIPAPESSPAGDGEKKEKKRRKRRQPSHVPLPMAASQVHIQETARKAEMQAEDTGKKKRRRRKKTTETAPVEEKIVGAADAEKPKRTKRKGSKTAEHPVAESVRPDEAATETVAATESSTEGELQYIPLDAQEEAELFVSPRLASESADPAHEATDPVDETNSTGSFTQSHRRPGSTARSGTAPTVGTGAAAQATSPRVATAVPRANVPVPTPNPNATPATPFFRANVPPAPPYNPNLHLSNGGFGGNRTPAAANLAPVAVPLNQSERIGRIERGWDAKSLWAGILIGGIVEHVRHKRKQKRRDKEHAKQVKALKNEHANTQKQLVQTEAKAERTKTKLEQQIERLKKAAPNLMVTPAVAPKNEQTPNQRTELRNEAPLYQAPATVTAERPAAVNPLVPSASVKPETKQPLVPKNERDNPDAMPEVPSDRRVETSAWHRIEIDKKTGKAVEAPTVSYGEEFQHEQHQEQLRKAIEEASMGSDEVLRRYASPLGTTATESTRRDTQPGPNTTPTRIVRETPITRAKQALQQSEPIDIALWVGLGLVVIAIIAVI